MAKGKRKQIRKNIARAIVNIKASFKDGILKLQAPKVVEKELERRRITID